jgi:L-threonylcarbamoyladenylate synthase
MIPVIPVNPTHPEPDLIARAAGVINGGGLVVIPTFRLYGLAVNALNSRAVDKVFAIKKRPPDNPILLLIKDRSELEQLVRHVPPSAERLIDRFWPGKVTLVFEASAAIPDILTAGTGKIGLRVPEHPVAAALTRALPHPITGTSANVSGEPGCNDPAGLSPQIIAQADMVLDAGRLLGGQGSTVIDVTVDPVRIIREGAVSRAEIFQAIT